MSVSSESPSSSSDFISSPFPVQELSLQKLNILRTARYIDLTAETIEKKSLENIIDRIVEVFNETIEEGHNYEHYPYEYHPKENFYELKVFTQIIKAKTRISRHLEKGGKKLPKKTNLTYLFFFYRDDPTEIIAATSGHAYSVVRACIDYKYPVQIAQKILNPNRILEMTRSHLVGPHLKETLINPAGHELLRTTTLYFLVDSFKCVVKEQSSLTNLSIFKKSRKDTMFKISLGLLRIIKKIPLEDYPQILDLFSKYIRGEKTFNRDDRVELADPGFEFLHFLAPSQMAGSRLNQFLVDQIFDYYQKERDQKVHFRHKYLSDYLNTSSICQIQYGTKQNYHNLDIRPFEIKEILNLLKTHVPVAFDSKESLLEAFQTTKIKFVASHKQIMDPLIDFLEGEIRLTNGDIHVKTHGMWYRLTADYHSLLQQDFRTLLKKTLIPKDHEAQLPLSWAGNVSAEAKFTEIAVKNEFKIKKGLRTLMKSLKDAKVAYIEDNDIKQKFLIGEILINPIIRMHKKDIEEKILSKKTCPDEKTFSKLFGDDAKIVSEELKKVRSIFYENNSKEKFVINPFTYPLKGIAVKESFVQFLEKYCKANLSGETEEDYNRSFLYDVMNSDKFFGSKKGWLVFDQICPDNIEPCDIVQYTPDTTYLYHVKEKFGQHTRDACSQILNAAKVFRSALSVNQPLDYLKKLWNKATQEKKQTGENESFLTKVKNQTLDLGKENFFSIFQERKLVFVYAFLEKDSQKLNEEAELQIYIKSTHFEKFELDQAKLIKELKNKGYLDTHGRLTSLFYATTKPKFSLDAFEEHKDAIFQRLSMFKSKSESTLAKLELIRLSQE